MVPLRIIAEALGAINLNFDRDTRVITFVLQGQNFTMTVGEPLPGGWGTPIILGGTTFVPLGFIVNEIGAEARWDRETRVAYIYL